MSSPAPVHVHVVILIIEIASLAFADANVKTILDSMAKKNKTTTNVRVMFKKNNVERVIEALTSSRSRFISRDEKETEFYKTLKAHADETQKNTIDNLEAFIQSRSRISSDKSKVTSFTQMWIVNELFVWDADSAVINHIASMEDMSEIEEEIIFDVNPHETARQTNKKDEVEWGVQAIQAPLAWKGGGKGKGAVVGIIDTGVQSTHEALKDNYRSYHGWFDPYTKKEIPFDPDGHGTFVTGIAVGTKGIGVAPEAQWIACRGMSGATGQNLHLIRCMQWMHCPTDPQGENLDCSKRPHIVNNSWSARRPGKTSKGFLESIHLWLAHNIVPIFGIGNNGPGCSTAGPPGLDESVIGVGATNERGAMWFKSSSGPTVRTTRIKPDIVAPGEDIVSASHQSDTGYVTYSGTSAAAPHVSGLAAVYYGKFPKMPVNIFRAALIKGVKTVKSSGKDCGGISETIYPNNRAGYGMVDFVEFDRAFKVIRRRRRSNVNLNQPFDYLVLVTIIFILQIHSLFIDLL